MVAPTTIYSMSLTYINGVCDSYVGQNVAAVAHVVGPFATTMLTLYVVLWGFASMRGLIREPVSEFIHRVLKIAIVFGVGYNLANYNTLITNTFLHGPDELVSGLAKSSGAVGLVSGLDGMLQQGFDLGGRFWAKAGVLDGDFGMYFVALFVYAMSLVVTSYAFFLMALSKVALTVLIGIGPIFFVGLLFQATAGFFNSWLRQLANYFLVPVLVVMVNLLIVNLFKRAANSATAMTDTTDVAQVFPFFAMGSVCLLALASVLSMAAGLAGGVSLSSFGMGRLGLGLIKHHSEKLSRQLAQQGGRAVAWGGKSVARGAWNIYQSRPRNTIRPEKTATKSFIYKR